MNTSLRILSKMRLLLPLAILAVLPLGGDDNNGEDHRGGAKDSIFVVLYQGPRVGDPAWTIKSGPAGPNNQKFRDVGGTCSMIPSDVHNVPGSAFERVTFEAKRNHLNVWEMVNDRYRLPALRATAIVTRIRINLRIGGRRLTVRHQSQIGRCPHLATLASSKWYRAMSTQVLWT